MLPAVFESMIDQDRQYM